MAAHRGIEGEHAPRSEEQETHGDSVEVGQYQGTVKWFNDAKGYGFIAHSDGADVFVHYSVIESDGFRTLKDGETVHYELKQGPKGLQASRVTRPQSPTETALSSAISPLADAPQEESLTEAQQISGAPARKPGAIKL